MMAQILSLEIIEGPAVHLKHTVAVAYAESFRGGQILISSPTSPLPFQNHGNL